MKSSFEFFAPISAFHSGAETCGHNVTWKPVPNQPDLAAAASGSSAAENRKHTRTRMKAMACIQESGRDDDVVEVSDIARGGVSFRGGHACQVNGWISSLFLTRPTPSTFSFPAALPGEKIWRTTNTNTVCNTSGAKQHPSPLLLHFRICER
jgi:hypothetical protein